MTRVLYYSGHPDISSYTNAGYATHMRGAIGAFERAGFEVERLISGDSSSAAAGSERELTRRRVAESLPWGLRTSLRDIRQIRSDRRGARRLSAIREPSFVYERYAVGHLAAARYCADRQIPLVLEINAPFSERLELGGTRPTDALMRRRMQAALSSATTLVTVTSALLDQLSLEGFRLPDDAVVKSNGVTPTPPLSSFRAGRTQQSIAYLGSMAPWQEVPLLIAAFDSVVRAFPSAVLHLIGDGDGFESVLREVQRRDLTGSIRIHGALERAAFGRILETASIGVLPGTADYCSPVKLFDYAQHGLSLVAPRSQGVEEVFTHGTTATLFEPGDKESLVKAILSLLEEPSLADSRAISAHSVVTESYTWDHVCGPVIERFQSR